MYIYTPPPLEPPSQLPISLPFRSSQSTKLSFLRFIASTHQQSVSHMGVYICQYYSLTSSQLSFPHCVHKDIFISPYHYLFSIPALQIGSSLHFSRFLSLYFSSVAKWVSDSLWPHGLPHARLPVHHQLPELAQIHIHQAIQPSLPLSFPSPPTLNLSQH